jgi:acylpyruvate hydrolase
MTLIAGSDPSWAKFLTLWQHRRMRWATIRTPDGTRAARVDGDALVELDARDVGELLERGDADETGTVHDSLTADYAPVVTHPGKIICQGLNYRSHILEMGHDLPTHPTLFAKFREALIGAHDDIVLPARSDAVDWEAELALVIGTRVRRASTDEAATAIAGFTVANDVSMRDWQNRSLEWLQGKTWEHSTPVGPWLVTPDEVGGVAPDLAIRCEVDGEIRQDARTTDLVFSAVDLVAYVSEFVTLEPGDLILTGTPAGVGHGMKPPVYLQAGQVVRTVIEGVGELLNPCRAEA